MKKFGEGSFEVHEDVLVNVNCYLPQAQLYQSGEYAECIDSILAAVKDLGEDKAYIFTGDFNSGHHNKRQFKRFKDLLPMEEFSANIPYTYAQNCQNGIVSTNAATQRY